MTQYWLMKTEPGAYAIDDLKREKVAFWDGVRNYQARNFMRDEMRVGDKVLFYHSNTPPVGVVGLAKVVKEGYVDVTQFDSREDHYDPKVKKENPRWYGVDVRFVKKFKEPVTLEELKANKKLKDMAVVQPGQRLSVQPVSKKDYEEVLRMARQQA